MCKSRTKESLKKYHAHNYNLTNSLSAAKIYNKQLLQAAMDSMSFNVNTINFINEPKNRYCGVLTITNL
jgi:hypothetical protein